MRKSIFLLTLMCLLTGRAMAQDGGEYAHFNDPFRVYVGAFFPSLSTDIAIYGTDVTPPPVDVEDVLGIADSDTVALAGMQWHISRRNSLEFEYFSLERDGFIDLIPDPVAVGDLIIESGSIDTAFDVSVGRLTYGFSVVRNERMDIQLKAGLHIADFSAALQLSGAVCDVTLGQMPPGCPGGQTPVAQSDEVTAPLPHFGASIGYAFTPTISGNFQIIGFAIELDDIDGSILEIDADIAWQPLRHLGFGAGLRYFNTNVKAGTSELNGEFDIEYFGPTVYVSATF